MAGVSLKKRWNELLHATLETWAHQILYQRCVYPTNSFGPIRFFGVRCHANRHPGVVQYIQESVAAGAQLLISEEANQFVLVIVDEAEGVPRELERYEIELSIASRPEWDDEAKDVTFERMERAMRNLILRVLGLGQESASDSETLSFRIETHCKARTATAGVIEGLTADGSFTLHEKVPIDVDQAPPDCFLWDDNNSGMFKLRLSMKRSKKSEA